MLTDGDWFKSIDNNLTLFVVGDFGDVGSLRSGLGGGFIDILSSIKCVIDSGSQ